MDAYIKNMNEAYNAIMQINAEKTKVEKKIEIYKIEIKNRILRYYNIQKGRYLLKHPNSGGYYSKPDESDNIYWEFDDHCLKVTWFSNYGDEPSEEDDIPINYFLDDGTLLKAEENKLQSDIEYSKIQNKEKEKEKRIKEIDRLKKELESLENSV